MNLKLSMAFMRGLFLPGPFGLVLAPTRELAIQIFNASTYLALTCGLRLGIVYGGAAKESQVMSLVAGVDVLIATPGRLIDFLDDGLVSLLHVSCFVLDEADRMLDMGFFPQVRKIAMCLSPIRQSMFLSATWPAEVESLAFELCTNSPIKIKAGAEDLTLNSSISQKVLIVQDSDKRKRLFDLLRELDDAKSKIIIFVKTKKSCEKLAKSLDLEGLSAAAIHGDKQQNVASREAAKRQHPRAVSGGRQEHPGGDRRGFARPRYAPLTETSRTSAS